MDWRHLHCQLVASHSHSPQEAKRIELAVQATEQALGELARLGHLYHLVPGPAPEPARWPMQVYHSDGRVREVFHPNDLLELGEGWYPTLEEARYRAGMSTQFMGRGGVKLRNLPALVK